MNKKGFTLVELLATITIMGIIMIMVVPAINSLQNTNKDKPYELYGESMIQAAKIYVNKEGEDITSLGVDNWQGCIEISYQELLNSKLIKVFDDDKYNCTNGKVRYTKTKNSGEYTYNLICTEKSTGETVFSHQDIPLGSCSQTIIS